MTPRPRKPRKCCCPYRRPDEIVFKPAGTPLSELERIVLDHDELEALQLCDGLALTQQEAGERMGVSRGTIQRLVTSSRRKVAEAITGGAALIVLPAAAGDVSHLPEA
jgi:predicted DNA-binding protein (UPF0251 family)